MDEVYTRLSTLRQLWSRTLDSDSPIDCYGTQGLLLEPVVMALDMLICNEEMKEKSLLLDIEQINKEIEQLLEHTGIAFVMRGRSDDEEEEQTISSLPVLFKYHQFDFTVIKSLSSYLQKSVEDMERDINDSLDGEDIAELKLSSFTLQWIELKPSCATLTETLDTISTVHTDISGAIDRLSVGNEAIREDIRSMCKLLRRHENIDNMRRPRLKQIQRMLKTVIGERIEQLAAGTRLIKELCDISHTTVSIQLKDDDLSDDYMTLLESTKNDLLKQHEEKCKEMYERYMKEIISCWDALGECKEERDKFVEKHSSSSIQALQKVSKYLSVLKPLAEKANKIRALINDRLSLIQRMKDFEVTASDPARLFRSSFQLNQEERFRKTALPTLLSIERKLFEECSKFETEAAKPFTIHDSNIPFVDTLQADISGRYVNETVFGFESHRKENNPHSTSTSSTALSSIAKKAKQK